MKYALGNMLNGAGGLNADQLALDLQFTADKTLTARRGPTPVLTRGSTGTFVGSNGLIQTAAVNAARFDHDPVTLASRGLLIEEGRTNLSLYSGALVNNTGWVETNTTSVIEGLGPDGNNAYNISETTASASHIFANTGGTGGGSATSVTSGTIYTGSIFLKKKAGSVDWIQLTLGGAAFTSNPYANFNLSTGQVGNSSGLASGTTPRIESYPNGWYRVSISAASGLTTTTNNTLIGFIQNTNGTTRLPSYAGSTSNSVLASLCQFEAGSFATSYIPTTTSALARSADVCSITGTNFTNLWNASEGSVFIGVIPYAPQNISVNQFIIDIGDGSSVNRTRLFRAQTSGATTLTGTSSNVTDLSITGASPATLVLSKLSFGMKLNDFALSKDGALSGTDTTANMMAASTTMVIGNSSVAAQPVNGTISAIRYYKKRLANSKLASLTV